MAFPRRRPEALERLKLAAGPEAAPKLDRAPSLIAASAVTDAEDPAAAEEDLHATAAAVFAVLLGAHDRGLAAYWRTPGVLRAPAGREALGIAGRGDGRRADLPRPAGPGAAAARAGRARELRDMARLSAARAAAPSGRGGTRAAMSLSTEPMIDRARALTELTSETFDVVVVGGGVTGAGVALDAASRGYSTAIVERADWAIGTSSRSSKMVHGGLRYLQNFDLGLVREALLERQLMVHLAPHLVYPTPYLVPQLGDDRRDVKIGIGLNMYDVMATTRVGQGRRQRIRAQGRGARRGPRSRLLVAGPAPDDLRLRRRSSTCRRWRRASRSPPISSTTARPTTSASC